MQTSFLKKAGAVILGVVVVAGSFAVGSRYGASSIGSSAYATSAYQNASGTPSNVDFSEFWQAWNILNQDYVPTHSTTTPTDQEKVYGAIAGLAASYGDPYTTFFPPAENQDFQTQISGTLDGIGLEVGEKDGTLVVIAPLKGSPAAKAGLKSGDMILKINNTDTSTISIDAAVSMIRGKKGTSVELTLLGAADKTPRVVTITREEINIPTIDTTKRSDGIFVISLYGFTADSAQLFRGALEQFAVSGDSKLILDLRGNPGGYLDAAVDMASWFLPSKDIIVKEDSEGHGQDQTYMSKGYDVFDKSKNPNFQMMILVDGGSASASEILSGALQQNGVAKLVGTKTFGKGSVQELINITPDTSLKVTVARWLTPNGTSISQKGIQPDVEVDLTDADATAGNDTQMAKAVELLGGNPSVKNQ